MNVAALASTSHQPGLFDMVASPWFSVRVGGSKPPGSYTAYCPNVNLAEASSVSAQRRRVPPSVAEAGVGTAAADDPSCSRSVGGWGGGPPAGVPGLRERTVPPPSEAPPPRSLASLARWRACGSGRPKPTSHRPGTGGPG